MQSESWPTSSEVNSAVGERVRLMLDEHGGLVGEVGLSVLCEPLRVLAADAHSRTAVLVACSCLSAGADWRSALWPAAGAELMMAAADVFDDVADLDPGSEATTSGGKLRARTSRCLDGLPALGVEKRTPRLATRAARRAHRNPRLRASRAVWSVRLVACRPRPDAERHRRRRRSAQG